MSGCGQQVSVGYLVCRMAEGSAADKFLFIHAPPELNCDDESCVYFRIYFPDGRPTYEGKINKGESHAMVKWSDIVNKADFHLEDRGFWGVSIALHYKSPEGEPQKTYADGYIFMHVIRKTYISLIENEEDENFVWRWKTPTNQTVKMTTGARVFVSLPREIDQSILK
jgi:hypothetical protein